MVDNIPLSWFQLKISMLFHGLYVLLYALNQTPEISIIKFRI